MTIREMHIEIEQSTQEVAANRGRQWLPEEIDWILNKIQDRFISSCLRPRPDGSGGFELDQVKGDLIRQLVTRANLTPYLDGTERYKCFLPANYRNLLADWSYTVDLCGAALPETSAQTLHISRILQSRSELVASPYYADVAGQFNGILVTVPDDLPIGNTYTGYPEKEDISFLVPWILWKSGSIYWEKFGNLYYPSHYMVVSTATPAAAVSITVDGEDTLGQTETISLTYNTGTGKRHNNRLCPTDIISSLNESHHYKSAHYSPITELEGQNLIIHRDNSFTVTGLGISYIRKPRPLSLSLNSDCELSGEDTHQAICDLATEYIKGTVQSEKGKELKRLDIAERVTI